MKKIAIFCLSIVSALAFSLGIVSCSSDTEKATLVGFEVEETTTVKYGELYEIPSMLVKDTDGRYYEVDVSVFDSENQKVALYSGAFTVSTTGNYKVVYTVNGNGFKETKTTVLTVDASGVALIEASSTRLAEIGESVEVEIKEDKDYTYAVTVKNNETEEVDEVTNYSFVPEAAGVYTITVTAKNVIGETSDYAWTIYVRPEMKEGEVEVFDENWTYVAEYGEDSRASTWEITNTAETGVKDRFGLNGTYAVLDTAKLTKQSDKKQIFLGMDIRGEKKYYKQLAKDGYKYVSFWFYIDTPSSELYPTKLCMNQYVGASYTISKGSFAGNQWVQVKMPLVPINYEDMLDRQSSLVDAYELFKNDGVRPLLIENESAADVKIYLSDIYAVKDVEVGSAEEADKKPSVGDSVNFQSYFEGDYDLLYTLSYGEKTIETNGSNYKFVKNGDYTLSAQTTKSQLNLNGKAEVTLSVQDVNQLSATPIIKERTGTSSTVNFADLNAKLTNGDTAVAGATATYSVSFFGEKIDCTQESFTATIDGCYDIEIDFKYLVDGVEYHSISFTTADVWSAANKYAILPVNSAYIGKALVVADGYLNRSWSAIPEVRVVSTANGVQGTYYETISTAQYHDVYFRPVYSKHYYQSLLAENDKISLNLRFYSADESGVTAKRDFYSPNVSKSGMETGGWNEVSLSLADFLNANKTYTYEYFTNGVLSVNEVLANGSVPALNAVKGRFLRFGSTGNFKTNVTFDGIWLMSESSDEATVTEKSEASVNVGAENDLIDYLTVTLGGKNATISNISVTFNGAELTLVNGKFTPVFAGDYLLNIRATYATDSGLKVYKDLEYTLTTAGVPLTVDEIQVTKTNGRINLWDLKNKPEGYGDEYDFKYTVYRIVGSDRTELESGKITQSTVFDFADYVTTGIGGFKVVYSLSAASNAGNSAFSSIDFHTVWVDVTADESSAVYQDFSATNFGEYYNFWNWTMKNTFAETAKVENGNLVITSKAERAEIQVLPMYSKSYYEKFKNQGLSVTFDFKIELDPEWTNKHGEISQPETLTVHLFGKQTWTNETRVGQWQTHTLPLETYLKYWDTLQTTNGSAAYNLRGLLTVENGVHRVDGVAYDNGYFTLTITELQIVKPQEAMTYELKVPETNAPKEGVAYDVSNMQVLLDGVTATDVSYEADESTGIRIENGKLLAPFGGYYDITVQAYAIANNVKYYKTFTTKLYVSGSEYTIISETVPKVFTVDERADGYDLKAVFQKDGKNALETGDTFKYVVYKLVGGEKTLVSVATTDGKIALSSLEKGKYYAEVQVVRGNNTLRLYSGYFSIIDSASTYLANGGDIMTFDDDYIDTFCKIHNLYNWNYALGGNEKPVAATNVADCTGTTKASALKIKHFWDSDVAGYVLMKSDLDIDVLYYFQQKGYSLQCEVYWEMPNTANWTNVGMQFSNSTVWLNAKANVWTTATIDLAKYIETYNAQSASDSCYDIELRKSLAFTSSEGSSYVYVTPFRLVAPTTSA